MLDKLFLQSFLKVNNASESMSDEEVRAVLTKAAWSKSEIDAAIALLRTGSGNGSIVAQTSGGNAFNPNMEFSSKQLSSLLGVDIAIDPRNIAYHYPAGVGHSPALRDMVVRVISGLAVVTLALGLALGLGISFLYYLKIGPFHV